jgi:hypothetical protein
MKINRPLIAAFIIISAFAAISARRPPVPSTTDLVATEPQFRALYKELVETNTAQSAGDCTLAATRMKARMLAGGFSDADLRIFAPAEFPRLAA